MCEDRLCCVLAHHDVLHHEHDCFCAALSSRESARPILPSSAMQLYPSSLSSSAHDRKCQCPERSLLRAPWKLPWTRSSKPCVTRSITKTASRAVRQKHGQEYQTTMAAVKVDEAQSCTRRAFRNGCIAMLRRHVWQGGPFSHLHKQCYTRFFDALMEMGTVTSQRTALAIPRLTSDGSSCTDSSK